MPDILGIKEAIKYAVLFGLYGSAVGFALGILIGRGRALVLGISTFIFCIAAKVAVPQLTDNADVYVPAVIAMPVCLAAAGIVGRLASLMLFIAAALMIGAVHLYV